MIEENLSKSPETNVHPGEVEEAKTGDLSRREALAVLGKHAVYTTPAVLALLSLKSNNARATSGW